MKINTYNAVKRVVVIPKTQVIWNRNNTTYVSSFAGHLPRGTAEKLMICNKHVGRSEIRKIEYL